MNPVKIATKVEEIYIKRTTDSVEIDFDFTQVYDCFGLIAFKIKSPISFALLFFLLQKVPKNNYIYIDGAIKKEFLELYKKLSGDPKGITETTFYNCLLDLQEARAIEKITRGRYYLNPYSFWRDDKVKRVDYLKIDAGSGQTVAYNPLQLIAEKKIEKKNINSSYIEDSKGRREYSIEEPEIAFESGSNKNVTN